VALPSPANAHIRVSGGVNRFDLKLRFAGDVLDSWIRDYSTQALGRQARLGPSLSSMTVKGKLG
jgi:hypothetical protein